MYSLRDEENKGETVLTLVCLSGRSFVQWSGHLGDVCSILIDISGLFGDLSFHSSVGKIVWTVCFLRKKILESL